MKLERVAERMLKRHRIPLTWEDQVIENIAASCTAVDTGARNIDHIINDSLLPGLSKVLLGETGSVGKHKKMSIGLDSDSSRFTCNLA